MERFRFVCIALTILFVASTIPNAGLLNTRVLSAAEIHNNYQKLPSYTDEPQAGFPAANPLDVTNALPVVLHSESLLPLHSGSSAPELQNNQSPPAAASENQTITVSIDQTSSVSDNQTDTTSDNETSPTDESPTDSEDEGQTSPVSDNQTDTTSEEDTSLVSDNQTDTTSEDETSSVSDNQTDTTSEDETSSVSDNQTSTEESNTTITVVEADEDTEIKSASGKVTLRVPKGAVSKRVKVKLVEHKPKKSAGMKMVTLLEFNAEQVDDGKKIKKFHKDLEVSIQHTPEELRGLNINSLRLYYLDEESKQWLPVDDSKFDSETMVLTATIQHFSYYGEQADPIL